MNAAVIVVRFRVEGWHNWPGAPEHRAYLAHRHRHMFHVEAEITVEHDDREVEFHDFLEFCRDHMPAGDLGARSCEMLARELANSIARRHGRACTVSVFEDGEVGARITRPASRHDTSSGDLPSEPGR